ncbi:hypothetical protein AAFF_G00383260 [Aldrovandia affinis]|uniref:Uncharacterized protein n=1 Tax=Aldrovandia affinis TaxID=143900 RepID=A0AAD7T8C5_9TELE|nr:hypothetical protein AAFF_G00383260 [Aldrovandia affinis]
MAGMGLLQPEESEAEKAAETALFSDLCCEEVLFIRLRLGEVLEPAEGEPIEAVSTIWTRSRKRAALERREAERVQSWAVSTPERTVCAERSCSPAIARAREHRFISKTVIKPESCLPCGKKIKFGKLSLKCRDCRVVAHPECCSRCALPCTPCLAGTPTARAVPGLLCGVDRTVKELKEKFLYTRMVPLLSTMDDVHVICSLLKDFFRNLKEPLLTFRLNQAFMEAAEIGDDDNSVAMMYQTVSELPSANRDTLAFLALHLQRYQILAVPLVHTKLQALLACV